MSKQPSCTLKSPGGMFIISIIVAAAISSTAQTVSWHCTTKDSSWVNKGTLTTSVWDNDVSNYIEINPATKYQVIEGWGGATNELGWDALSALSQTLRDQVLKAIFDSTECGINNARIPIGANDYSPGYYSCAETPNDYQMNQFTIAREKLRLIPYLKGALAFCPHLRVWGSPWSPPAWMKTNNNIASGSLIQTSQNLTAYALYFEKWVRAIQAEGIPLYAVHIQNEPNIANNYPSCLMSGAEMRVFIRDYIGPRFKTNSVNSEIWLGTIQNDDFSGRIKPILDDNAASAYITGVGLQWGGDRMIPQIRSAYPTKKIMQTEIQCGNFFWIKPYDSFVAPNDWNYGMFAFNQMSQWIKGGGVCYCMWNIVLDSSGKSWDNWPQNSMISIFKGAKTVRYNPQFYVVKHFGRYVKRGAYSISAAGNFGSGTASLGSQYGSVPAGDKLAFLNTDGSMVIVVRNSDASAKTVAVKVGTTKFKPTLPAHSVNTFVIRPAVAVRSLQTGKQALFFRQSRDGISFSVPRITTARHLKLEVIDALGKTVAVPLSRMSMGGDCFVPCNFTIGSGVYFARMSFNGIVTTNRLVF